MSDSTGSFWAGGQAAAWIHRRGGVLCDGSDKEADIAEAGALPEKCWTGDVLLETAAARLRLGAVIKSILGKTQEEQGQRDASVILRRNRCSRWTAFLRSVPLDMGANDCRVDCGA